MTDTGSWCEGDWALILALQAVLAKRLLELARLGMNILGVHLDRKSTLPNAERIEADIRALGREVIFFNANAYDPEKRGEILHMAQRSEESGKPIFLRVLLHSLAFGTAKTLYCQIFSRGHQ